MRGEPKQSVLSPAQIRALGKAIRAHEGQSPMAAAAIRLIALTGMRRAEACRLRWRELDEDGHCLRLEATKTGRSTRPIGKPALAVLRALPQETGAQWVFPRADGEAPAEMKKPMKAIFAAAGRRGRGANPAADICQRGRGCRVWRIDDCRVARP